MNTLLYVIYAVFGLFIDLTFLVLVSYFTLPQFGAVFLLLILVFKNYQIIKLGANHDR